MLRRCAAIGRRPDPVRGNRAILGRVSLQIDQVTKRFGATVALDGLTFDVPPGEVFGFLGANGAGKTTTMRICLGIVAPDARRDPLGRPAGRRAAAADVGLPARGARPLSADDRPGPARLLRVAVRRSRRTGRDATRSTGWPASGSPTTPTGGPRSCRRATSRRSSSSRPILHEPDVLLMDEPFTGLDPINLVLLREAFMELRDRGRTLIFSTHQMEAAEAMCESVAIVDRGRLVAGGRLRDLKRASGRQSIRLALDGRDRRRPGWPICRACDGVRRERDRRASSSCRPGADAAGDPGRHPRAAAPPSAGSRSPSPSLEALFIELVGRPAEDELAGLGAPRRRRPCPRRPRPVVPPDGPTRSAPAERRDHRPARVPRPRPRPAVPGLDGRADGAGPRSWRSRRSPSATSIARRSPRSPSSRPTPELAARAVAVADSLLNVAASGRRSGHLGEAVRDRAAPPTRAAADRDLARGRVAGILRVERLASAPARRRLPDQRRRPTASAASSSDLPPSPSASSTGRAACRRSSQLGAFQTPVFRVEPINAATDGGPAARRAGDGQPRRSSASCSSSCCS